LCCFSINVFLLFILLLTQSINLDTPSYYLFEAWYLSCNMICNNRFESVINEYESQCGIQMNKECMWKTRIRGD